MFGIFMQWLHKYAIFTQICNTYTIILQYTVAPRWPIGHHACCPYYLTPTGNRCACHSILLIMLSITPFHFRSQNSRLPCNVFHICLLTNNHLYWAINYMPSWCPYYLNCLYTSWSYSWHCTFFTISYSMHNLTQWSIPTIHPSTFKTTVRLSSENLR